MVRTSDRPNRTTGPPIPHCDGGCPLPFRAPVSTVGSSRVARAPLALMSGRRTVTPCRRASAARGRVVYQTSRLGFFHGGVTNARALVMCQVHGETEIGESHSWRFWEA